MKKTNIFLMVILIALFTLVLYACSNDKSINFSVDETTKTLTISGEGLVKSSPFAENDERVLLIDTIVFDDEITGLDCSLLSFSNTKKIVFGKNFSHIAYEGDENSNYILPLYIESFEIDANNKHLAYDNDGILRNQETVFYCTNKGLKDFVCDKSIKTINAGAFENVDLKNLKLNDGLERIGAFAFASENFFVDTLVIPESVREIGFGAFTGAYGGEETKINNLIFKGTTKIAANAFYMSGIKEVDFGNANIEIGSQAFYCCKIKELSISNNIRSVGGLAFAYNPLKKVKINTKDSDIDSTAFSFSAEEVFFEVDNQNINWCSDERGSLYSKDMSTLYYTNHYDIKDGKITFGEGFETLESYCVTINDAKCFIVAEGVINIQDYALDNVHANNIVIPSTVEKLGHISVGDMDYYNYESVTILNPECNLDDFYCGSIETIKGYKDSTAEKFAIENDINFVGIT